MAGGVIVRKFGDQIEIRYRDVPLFEGVRARRVLATIGRAYMSLALQEIAGRISDEAPVGVTGNLAQSFGASPAAVTGGIELLGQTIEDLHGRVFSSLPYAIVIDQGRTPGQRMPPVDAIMLWVERVLGIAESDDFELEETAWAIAKSIAKKGIEARHFVDRGLKNALPNVEGVFEIMADAMGRALTEPEGQGGGVA